MRYRGRRRFNKRTLVGVMLAGAALALFLPSAITGRLINLVQVLVPLQDGFTRAADGAGGLLHSDGEPVPPAEHERLLKQNEALRNTVASLSNRIQVLEEDNRQLTGLRDRGLGPRGVLIPARVIAGDLLAWRESGLIDAGTLRGVAAGAAVTTRTMTLDAGSSDGLGDGMAVLAGEALVGWVEHVGTHTARVKLLSDPACQMPVRIGRQFDEGFQIVPAQFWLQGAGAGRMHVIDVDHRYVEESAGGEPDVAVGDVVVTDAEDPSLPVPLPLGVVIGTITELARNPDNQLLYTLTVRPALPGPLRSVYVLDLSRDAGSAAGSE